VVVALLGVLWRLVVSMVVALPVVFGLLVVLMVAGLQVVLTEELRGECLEGWLVVLLVVLRGEE
jgi:hypothetical protein